MTCWTTFAQVPDSPVSLAAGQKDTPQRVLLELCGIRSKCCSFCDFSVSKKGILLVTTVKGKERKVILYLKHQDGRGWEHLLFLLADADNYLRTFDSQWESCSWPTVTWTLHPALTVASVSWQIDKSLVGPHSERTVEGKTRPSQAFPQPAEKSLTQIIDTKKINRPRQHGAPNYL